MFRKSVQYIVLFIFILAVVSPQAAKTIPAFARKYGLSCTTCHTAAPKLKAYGDDFAGNGFQLPDDDEPVRAFQDTGDDNLLLQRDFPLAIRFDAYARYQSEHDVDNDLQTPFGLKVMSGGNIAKDIGYYFYFYMDERGEVAGVEDAYVHFNNIKGTELDLMIGQFQISDPLFKRELRLTYEDYKIYTTEVGASSANLKYDRGVIATYSLPTGTDFVVELINGNGIGEAGGDHLFDDDSFKNVFAKVSQGISIATVGLFGYTGSEDGENGDNAFSYLGPDISVGTERVEVNAQYVLRTDDNPLFLAAKPKDEIETTGVIGEVVFNPFPDTSRLFGVLLYNKVDSDFDNLDYESMTAHVSWLFKTNLRFTAELTQDMEHEETLMGVGFMTGF